MREEATHHVIPAEIKYMPDKHGYLMVEEGVHEAINVRTEGERAMRVLTCNTINGGNIFAVSQLLDLGRKGHARVLDMEVPWNLPYRCEP